MLAVRVPNIAVPSVAIDEDLGIARAIRDLPSVNVSEYRLPGHTQGAACVSNTPTMMRCAVLSACVLALALVMPAALADAKDAVAVPTVPGIYATCPPVARVMPCAQ